MKKILIVAFLLISIFFIDAFAYADGETFVLRNDAYGHNVEDIIRSFGKAKEIKNVPTALIAHTVKGKGVSFMENKYQWHGATIDLEAYEIAMKELGG